jgi:hypothetical protein
MNRSAGLFAIASGAGLILIGLLIYLGGFSWFGRLPGDIRYEGEHVRFYAPLVSMLLISLAVSLIFYLVRRFF